MAIFSSGSDKHHRVLFLTAAITALASSTAAAAIMWRLIRDPFTVANALAGYDIDTNLRLTLSMLYDLCARIAHYL
ncbi:MAG: hypothetical protein ABI051_18930 [Vicinamibacterales bacterium]